MRLTHGFSEVGVEVDTDPTMGSRHSRIGDALESGSQIVSVLFSFWTPGCGAFLKYAIIR